MNPFVVWMPTVAAAALLTTAAYVSMGDDFEPVAAQPEPPADVNAPLASDAEVDAAARDSDGSDVLTLVENALRMARRLWSSQKNSPPTINGRRSLRALANRAGYGLKKLSKMRSTVPDATFARAEDIAREIKSLADDIDLAYEKYRKEREPAAPAAPVAAPPVAAPALAPAPAYASDSSSDTDSDSD